jgi:hypothetical protein
LNLRNYALTFATSPYLMARKTRNREQISAYVDLSLKKEVEAIASRERRSVSDVIQMIIEKFLKDGGSFRPTVS